MADKPSPLRGVTRPMAAKEIKNESADRASMHMLDAHHKQSLWCYWMLIILGAWLMTAPFTFGYSINTVDPSGGRELWLSVEQRISFSIWNDVVCGALLIIFGWRSLLPNRPISRWIACFIGVYISMAPIIFWAPTATAYLNDTIVGAMAIAFSVVIPGVPKIVAYSKEGPDLPPGWTYNPSSWPQRWAMIVPAFLGWLVSRYITTYQLGYTDELWDPFFGEGSERVLDSDLSHSIPISDAGLGALAYTLEVLLGFMGSTSRWRTMPWMVILFGIMVVPLGLVHIILVISQPIVVGFWCTPCLLAAAIMLPMIPLGVDEVFNALDFLRDAYRRKLNMWNALWKGGTMEGTDEINNPPELLDMPRHPQRVLGYAVRGVSAPWNLAVSALIGLYIMFSPALFALPESASHIHYFVGALIIVTSVVAMGEVIRIVRYFNIVLGAALAVLPWIVAGAAIAANLSATIAGVTVIALAFRFGPRIERFGYWEKLVK